MRAIILAAGMGTRLRPLTDNIPKSLVKVCGEPMVERQIRFLKEKGIDDIIVVTGYLSEKFDYLKEKYSVQLVYNDKYDIYNNVYTMYLIRDFIGDSFITEADVYMVNNFFETNLDTSKYFSGVKQDYTNEWELVLDNGRVYDLNVGSGTGHIMSGISYWTKEDGKKIKEKLEEVIEEGDFSNVYWDDVVSPMLKNLNVQLKEIDTNDWFEIDSIEDHAKAEAFLLNK